MIVLDLDRYFECVLVREVMAEHQFMFLKKHLYFNNNSWIPNDCTDGSYKIRPLLKCLNKNFMQFDYLHNDYFVEEKIVRYFRHQRITQFIGGNPV